MRALSIFYFQQLRCQFKKNKKTFWPVDLDKLHFPACTKKKILFFSANKFRRVDPWVDQTRPLIRIKSRNVYRVKRRIAVTPPHSWHQLCVLKSWSPYCDFCHLLYFVPACGCKFLVRFYNFWVIYCHSYSECCHSFFHRIISCYFAHWHFDIYNMTGV